MAAADAAWLHMDRPTNRMLIVSVLMRGRRRPPGGPHWQDYDDFDLSLHVHRSALPAPGRRPARW
jgi:hypothetical protein